MYFHLKAQSSWLESCNGDSSELLRLALQKVSMQFIVYYYSNLYNLACMILLKLIVNVFGAVIVFYQFDFLK